MAASPELPEFVHRLKDGETFRFACHSGVRCFTECCRMLELSLTPYDVLRLRRATGLSSQQLLDRYILIEREPHEAFPRFYLTMVDDGRASCAFLSPAGCSVYAHRPAACRTYPMGRAVTKEQGALQEFFVLIKEDHCLGFAESTSHDAKSYSEDQELPSYTLFNDKMATLLQHPAIRQGYLPNASQLEDFTLALYNLDRFREQLEEGKLDGPAGVEIATQSDEQLLELAMEWVKTRLFAGLPKNLGHPQGKCASKRAGENGG